SIL
ncbi:exodeoxyribonuclease V, alpha subunit, partial [Vibrio parahaemolyticus V-223/04]